MFACKDQHLRLIQYPKYYWPDGMSVSLKIVVGALLPQMTHQTFFNQISENSNMSYNHQILKYTLMTLDQR